MQLVIASIEDFEERAGRFPHYLGSRIEHCFRASRLT
jgi:hypothetical protein